MESKFAPVPASSQEFEDLHDDPGGQQYLTTIVAVGARGTLLASLVYLCWRAGVDGVSALTYFSLATVVTVILTLAYMLLTRRREWAANKVGLLAIATLWVAFAFLQTIPLPSSLIATVAPGTHQVRATLIHDGLDELNSGLAVVEDAVPAVTTLSTAPGLTIRRIARDGAGLSVLFCAFVLFNTQRSRRWLAWTVLLNAVGLSCWGVVQYATESSNLFPGIENPIESSYFSTFIYKNAGAAALVSGVAIAAGFIYWVHIGFQASIFDGNDDSMAARSRSLNSGRRRRSFRSLRFSRSNNQYQRPNHWIDPFHIGICCLLGILVVGLVTSDSRGACAAAVVAAIVTVAVRFRSIRVLDAIVGSIILVLTAGVFIWLTDVHEAASRSSERMTMNWLMLDMRWSHWSDGVRTAWSHFPFGSGVGTYGYAQLAQQSYDSHFWFREAHNQYLETVAEAGVPGLVLMVLGVILLARMCWRLFQSTTSREARGWGLIGLLLFTATALQSLCDFIVLIPANMYVYAAVFGAILALYQQHPRGGEPAKSAASGAATDRSLDMLRRVLSPFGRFSFATLLLVLAGVTVHIYGSQHSTSRALKSTVYESNDYPPHRREIERNLATLDAAIAGEPLAARLYQRRALWRTLWLRDSLVRAGRRESVTVPWENTSRETMFATFMGLDEENANALREQLFSDSDRQFQLRGAVADIAESLTLNPFVPQTQLAAALVSPLVGESPTRWSDNCRRLSRSSPELLYVNGTLALWMGDLEMMTEYWRRNLRLVDDRRDIILLSGETILGANDVVRQLIPVERTAVLMHFLRRKAESDESPLDPALLADAMKSVRANPILESSRRHAALGQIYTYSLDTNASRKHWKQALDADARNLDYRYEYALALLRCQQYDSALKQAVLGQTLEPHTDRFKSLAKHIEAEQLRQARTPTLSPR